MHKYKRIAIWTRLLAVAMRSCRPASPSAAVDVEDSFGLANCRPLIGEENGCGHHTLRRSCRARSIPPIPIRFEVDLLEPN